MKISIASGKGGTGKTTIAVNLALSVENAQYIDCDVEEPNGHIFLRPEIEEEKVVTLPYPRVDYSKCDLCGECADVCEFGALAVLKDQVLVFDDLCHSCGACVLLCPQKAFFEVPQEIGRIEIGHSGNVAFVQGKLKLGSTRSHPLVQEVKKHIDASRVAIVDAPPGTSCPVVEAVRGTDFTLWVTEPTPFGLNDLKLAVAMNQEIGVPGGIVVNRSDGEDALIEKFAREKKIPILLRIPLDRKIAESYSRGEPLAKMNSRYYRTFQKLFREVQARVEQ